MKNCIIITLLAMVTGCVCNCVTDNTPNALSPDGRNEIRLLTEPLSYQVLRDGVVVADRADIGIMLDGRCLVENAAVKNITKCRIKGSEKTPFYKKSEVSLRANETLVDFGDEFSIRLIARDDGVAYRFETKMAGEVIVNAEKAELTIPDRNAVVWTCFTGNFGQEETIPERHIAGEMDWRGRFAYLPFTYSVNGKWVSVVESDVHDYPIWNFVIGDNMPDAKKIKIASAFQKADGGKDYLAATMGTRTFPWRGFVLADEAVELCENDLVYALATPAAKTDWSWVKPGKVAWDWWNDCNFGPDHPDEGLNTKGYHHYVDFAARHGIEYVILDAGWSGDTIWTYNKDVDVPEIIAYAKERGVGIILWMHWTAAYLHEAEIASHYAEVGAKGFKVDFMDRGDELVAGFLEKFADECAKNKMMVDYHGVYRPVGLNRTYPNIVNYEGIHGLEQMKWFGGYDFMAVDVRHFFLRFTAGQADYTPGAMLNYPIGAYGGNWHTPGSIGTRCHQMALMSLYFAPLQMLCDNPVQYEQELECVRYMSLVPVIWDETIGLGGSPDTMAAVARKAANGDWYAAGITNSESRDFKFSTEFLGKGKWNAEIFRDASDSDTEPKHYIHETMVVKAGDELAFTMAKGGGFTVRFTK